MAALCSDEELSLKVEVDAFFLTAQKHLNTQLIKYVWLFLTVYYWRDNTVSCLTAS